LYRATAARTNDSETNVRASRYPWAAIGCATAASTASAASRSVAKWRSVTGFTNEWLNSWMMVGATLGLNIGMPSSSAE
jgi:hypothetical protein